MRRSRRLQWLCVLLLLLAQEIGVFHLTLHAARSPADVQGTSRSLPADCAPNGACRSLRDLQNMRANF